MKGLIGITKPQQSSVMSLARRVAEEMGEELGGKVGVALNFLDKTSDATAMKFMTEEILLHEILNDPLLTKYSVIIIDDVEHRSALTDTVFGLLKKIIKKRISLKIIIISTSTDAEFINNFFTCRNGGKEKPLTKILSIKSPKRQVKVFYKNTPCPNYVEGVTKTILKIHQTESSGNILAFLTGEEEIGEVHDALKEYIIQKECNDMQVIPILSKYDRKPYFNSSRNIRKIVLTINIVDTLTIIPNIIFVVDCGFAKLQWYNPAKSSNSFTILPVSKDDAQQRSSYAGRERFGKAYRLYSEDSFKEFTFKTPPEMRRVDLCSTVIQLKALGVENILRFDFPSPPPAKNLLKAIEILYALDVLDKKGRLTKPLGYFLAEVPFNPMVGKMLYMSGKLGCSEEIISIIAMLHVGPIFNKTSSKAQVKARVAKRYFEVAEGDLITLLNVYTAFVENGKTLNFARRYFLIYNNLKRASETRELLAQWAKKKLGIPLISCNGNIEILGKCITAGFFPNTVYLHHSGVYRTIRGNTEVSIHPTSALRTIRNQPKFIIYCELIETTKLFIKDLTVIQESWLTEFASHYFNRNKIDN